ncbi:MAG: chitinase [Lachnospiraceae bacterium]|nr:chitinase [Lachnospiraceae bacterium]
MGKNNDTGATPGDYEEVYDEVYEEAYDESYDDASYDETYDDAYYGDPSAEDNNGYYEEPPRPRKKKTGRRRSASSKKKGASRSGGRRAKRANRDLLKRFGQSVLAIVVALILIVAVIAIAFGKRIRESFQNHEELGGRWLLSLLYPEKYSYGNDPANLKDYFQLYSDDDVAIVLQDERIAAHAKYLDGAVYFSIDTIRDLFTDRFYVNSDENVLLYSTSKQVIRNVIGEKSYEKDGKQESFSFPVSRFGKDGTFYIAADYVRLFADFDYSFHTNDEHINRVQVYTSWGEDRIASLKNETKLRLKGGIKSEVLRSLEKGEEVEVLNVMETWTMVKTNDAFIGYVENKCLSESQTRNATPASGAYQPEADYAMTPPLQQVVLGWHQMLADADNGSGMASLTEAASSLNVVSPTWYFLQDEEGTYKSLASAAYVQAAHDKGYQVWALVENMDAETDFEELNLFSSSERRASLIEALVAEAEQYGFDGINMDIEMNDANLGKTGPHYVQFLRELSIALHARGLVLSVDVPPPTESNKAFDLKELGYVTDYVVLMAYDEHYAGSDAGSVSSIPFVEKAVTDTLDKYKVPAEKIVCGLPFYTRIWRTEGSSTHSEAVSMPTAWEWVESRNITPDWLDDCCQYYVEKQDGTALYQIWLEDPESLKAKIDVISGHGIHSIAAWKLGLEDKDVWPVISDKLK